MPTTMIRVQPETHKKLRALASLTGGTMPQLVAMAVEEYERKLFWEQVTLEFSSLRDNPKSWKHEMEERAAWDAKCEDVRSVSKQRLSARLGKVKPHTLAAVEVRIRRLLGLP